MCVHWQQTWQWTILMGRKFRHLQNSAATCFVQRAAQELSRLLSAVCRLVKIVLGNKFSKASKTGTRKGKAQICTGLLDVGLWFHHGTTRRTADPSCDWIQKLGHAHKTLAWLCHCRPLHVAQCDDSCNSLKRFRRLQNDVQGHHLQQDDSNLIWLIYVYVIYTQCLIYILYIYTPCIQQYYIYNIIYIYLYITLPLVCHCAIALPCEASEKRRSQLSRSGLPWTLTRPPLLGRSASGNPRFHRVPSESIRIERW